MSELRQRSVTGLLFIAVIIGSIYFHPLGFASVFLFFTLAGMIEFYKLTAPGKLSLLHLSGIVAGGGLFTGAFLLFYLNHNLLVIFSLAGVLLLPGLLTTLTRNSLRDLAIVHTGILYVAAPFAMLNLLLFPFHLSGSHTPTLLLGYFLLLWSFDTGAYITGKPLGKHRMAEALSPGKTWEGLAGGLLIAGLVTYFVSRHFSQLSVSDWYVMLIIIVIMGVIGDFFESVLKRIAGVKDSGNLLPGHGGVLDRFDSVLLSVPVVTIFYLIKYLVL